MQNYKERNSSRKRLSELVFRDKVLGCWLGKNAGGTLGEPWERKFGVDEMFDVHWYSHIPEGGIPNDDLELQLIWFQALKERGPGITAWDLAEYWLDCVMYNFDEYGLSKANLKRGLVPPISGWHNNWFKNCMGSPIRSEIWACIAPGEPRIAAKYAFEDALCDHAGGESVFGEVFNAVLESCAFFESDKYRLIELGLASIPESCLTSRSIRDAWDMHKKGIDWREARNILKDRYSIPLAQYSPVNMGFQIIGLLYGEDFGDAICKAVDCGWDTDCTAATVGAILGIIEGASRLPEKWIKPLGYNISTNLRTGGIRNLRAPTDINELTDQVCAEAKRVLKFWDAEVAIEDASEETRDESSCFFRKYEFKIDRIAPYEPNVATWNLGTVSVSLRYLDSASIFSDRSTPLELEIHNPHPEAILIEISVLLPEKWSVEPIRQQTFTIEAYDTAKVAYNISVSDGIIEDSNRGYFIISAKNRMALCAVPLVLLGGSKWLVSPLFEGKTLEDDCGIDESLVPSTMLEEWSIYWRSGNDLSPESFYRGKPGSVFFFNSIWSPEETEVILGVSNTGRMKIWLNGQLCHTTVQPTCLRPNLGNGGGDGSNYCNIILHSGWNDMLIKLERGEK
ncbi:ADP-ribosylglycohydrolase family protein, partial [Rectinema subterraneum]